MGEKEIITSGWLLVFISTRKRSIFFSEHLFLYFRLPALSPLLIAKLKWSSTYNHDMSDPLLYLLYVVYPLQQSAVAFTFGNTDQLRAESRNTREDIKFWNLNWKPKWVSRKAGFHGLFLDWNQRKWWVLHLSS